MWVKIEIHLHVVDGAWFRNSTTPYEIFKKPTVFFGFSGFLRFTWFWQPAECVFVNQTNLSVAMEEAGDKHPDRPNDQRVEQSSHRIANLVSLVKSLDRKVCAHCVHAKLSPIQTCSLSTSCAKGCAFRFWARGMQGTTSRAVSVYHAFADASRPAYLAPIFLGRARLSFSAAALICV